MITSRFRSVLYESFAGTFMLAKTSEVKLAKDTWDLMQHWSLVLPPSRPSAVQLERIKNQIQEIDRSSPVAVLGSTPEFRDLLYECGFDKVFCLDRNLNMYKAMTEARVYRSNEALIRGDWLETLGDHKGHFSVVLSDLTSGNIPYESRSYFYHLVSNALAPQGLFCDKVLTHPIPHLRLDDLIAKYSHLPINLFHINHFNCEALFCSELLYDKAEVDTTSFYSELEETVKNERVQTFIRQTKLITPPGFIWWYGKDWEELKQDYCPDLDIVACDDDDITSPYYRRAKYFALKRR